MDHIWTNHPKFPQTWWMVCQPWLCLAQASGKTTSCQTFPVRKWSATWSLAFVSWTQRTSGCSMAKNCGKTFSHNEVESAKALAKFGAWVMMGNSFLHCFSLVFGTRIHSGTCIVTFVKNSEQFGCHWQWCGLGLLSLRLHCLVGSEQFLELQVQFDLHIQLLATGPHPGTCLPNVVHGIVNCVRLCGILAGCNASIKALHSKQLWAWNNVVPFREPTMQGVRSAEVQPHLPMSWQCWTASPQC